MANKDNPNPEKPEGQTPSAEFGYIKPRPIVSEMEESYLDYAMSVIIARALPDVRDGLKPVHRRILYAMGGMGLSHTAHRTKSAKVVGEVLGKFHPHGDIAVYDTLVRMAQDFSMAYPSIDGQGNFGCFTKDTKVRLTDSRNLTFEELIKEDKQGKRNYTFAFDAEKQRIEITEIKNPRLTRKKAEVIKVILDNGEEIKCTPDHLFMLRDGSYKKARNLKPNDSLMPLYTDLYEGKDDLNLKDYELLHQPLQNRWEFVHHLADKWNLENNVYKKSAGKIRHHKDFNKLNNNPDNIQRIQWNEHWRFHKKVASWRHKNDPEYVKNLVDGRKRFLANLKNLQEISARLTARNKKNWQDPAYRKKMGGIIRRAWQKPEYREKAIEVSRKTLRNLWKKKGFRELLSKLKSEELKKRWQDKDYKDFIAKITRKTSLKIWSNPQHRLNISRLSKKQWENSEYRWKTIENLKRLWQDPEFRSKYSSDHFRKAAKKLWENPEIRELHREKAKRQWENQEFRNRFINGVIKGNQRRLEENPDLMRELAQKAATSLREKWQDPLYKERVVKSKILGFVGNLLKENQVITSQLYEKERTTGLPKIKTALKYFSGFEDLVSQAKQKYNHKVVRIEAINKKEDVYDLTVEPWHNFALAAGIFVHNSIDGDPPAAMRYTEVRLKAVAEELLADIDKETVEFVPNYDGTLQEPKVLPAKLPNLILNGSLGIAVGMTTNIPPHNLKEVAEGITLLIDKPQATLEELMEKVEGPDFPTGGRIYGIEGIRNAYATGKGAIACRGEAEIEETKRGNFRIIISSLPYQVNKAELVTKIAELAKAKKIDGVSDLRDESDRKAGVRILLELKSNAFPKKVLNRLFEETPLQTTFHVTLLALVDGIQPRILTLKDVFQHFIDHRQLVVRRRSQFELNKAKARAHILEGLTKALKTIDKVIETIKKSETREKAQVALVQKFALDGIQANAILEMRLSSLAALERKKIEEELGEKRELIKKLEAILKDESKILQIIKAELKELAEKYGGQRRTKIFKQEVKEFRAEDLIPNEQVTVTFTRDNYIKRVPTETFRMQRRGGKGVMGMATKEEDVIEHLATAMTHDDILFFTDRGRVFIAKVYELPSASRQSKGQAIVNILQISPDEKITSIIILDQKTKESSKYLFMATRKGVVKKTPIKDFQNIRKTGIIAVRLRPNDQLSWVKTTSGEQNIILVTKQGQAIYFEESDVRSMGRSASGVRGIKLKGEDEVITAEIIQNPQSELLTILENGFGKRTIIGRHFHTQKRGGVGLRAARVNEKTGPIVGALVLEEITGNLVIGSRQGKIIRIATTSAKRLGRDTQGVRVMRFKAGDKVASVTFLLENDLKKEAPKLPEEEETPPKKAPKAPSTKKTKAKTRPLKKPSKPTSAKLRIKIKKQKTKPKKKTSVLRSKTKPVKRRTISKPKKPFKTKRVKSSLKPSLKLKEKTKKKKSKKIESLAGLAWEGRVRRVGSPSPPSKKKKSTPKPKPRSGEIKKRKF